MSRRKYKIRHGAAMPDNSSVADAIGAPSAVPEMTAPPEDEAKNALRSRVAELEAAEAARAAAIAAGQQRAAANPINQMTARQKAWLEAHPETVTDELRAAELRAAVIAAHRAGFEPDSDEFYHAIETRMGYHQPESAHEPEPMNGGSQMPQFPTPPARRPPMVSAPVSRAPYPGSNGGPVSSKITLSPEQREWARRSGLSDAEYAKQFQRLARHKVQGDYPER
jgi:hypothetical protein